MRVTRTAVLSKITEILAELLDNPELQLTEESTADSVEDWDSVNHVKLLIALESDLGIQFATDEVNGVQNVGALIDVIQNKLAAGSSVAM
jgi:acyl carrier protein